MCDTCLAARDKPPGAAKGNICRRGHRVRHPGSDSPCNPPSLLGNNTISRPSVSSRQSLGPTETRRQIRRLAPRESVPTHPPQPSKKWLTALGSPQPRTSYLGCGAEEPTAPRQSDETDPRWSPGTNFARPGYTAFSKQRPRPPRPDTAPLPTASPQTLLLPQPIVPKLIGPKWEAVPVDGLPRFHARTPHVAM